MRRITLVAFAAHVAFFAALIAPWIPDLARGVPREPFMDDAYLVVWLLAWAYHALGTAPWSFYDAPINYPTRAALTGSDHLAGCEVVFAPVYAASGNAVLAANATMLLSYPLAATAMCRLLVELGCSWTSGWIAGVLFALGPLRVPATLHVLQYLNVFLPLAVLATRRLRDIPTLGRAGALGAIVLLGFLTSYYLAVIIAVTLAVWALVELVRPLPERGRFVAMLAVALAGATVLLGAASIPYFARAGEWDAASGGAPDRALLARLGPLFGLVFVLPGFSKLPWYTTALGPVPAGFVFAGLVAALRAPSERLRTLARAGIATMVVGFLLLLGPYAAIGGTVVPLPFAIIANSPARFFRAPARFVVLMGFGTALLAGAGLDAVRERLRSRWARTAILASATAAVLWLGTRLCVDPIVPVRAVAADAPAYDAVAKVTAGWPVAPLLELPRGTRTSGERRIGQTHHWLPSILDHGTIFPAGAETVGSEIDRLAGADLEALRALVDRTGLGWLLLRSPPDWGDDGTRRATLLARLDAGGWTDGTWRIGDWILVRLRPPPSPDPGQG